MSITLSNKKVTLAVKLRFAFIVALACLFAVSGCATPRNFPLENKKEYRYKLSKEDDTFIAATFSGGGMRAAALSYGALMALKETTKLKKGQATWQIKESVSNPCTCYTNESENEEESDLGDKGDPVNKGHSEVECVRTKETRKSENGKEISLIDKVDLVSSVSGGSVTAAYWALRPDGLEDLKKQFLCKNVKTELLIKTIVNPIKWLQLSMPYYSRIDVFRDYLEEELFQRNSAANSDSEKRRSWDYDYDQEVFEEVFAGATYEDLMDEDKEDNNHPERPFIILNTTDMETGKVFSFTQDMFDYLCADLKKFKLADAVAASAAYPVFLTALTVKNYWADSECQIASQLKKRIQVSEKDKEDALVRAEEQVKAKKEALARAEEQVKAKKQAWEEAKGQKWARELDVVRAKEQVKAKEQALEEATEQVKAKEQALEEATEQVKAKEQPLVRAEEQARAKKEPLVKADEQVKVNKQAWEEAKGQKWARELDVVRAKEQVKAKEQVLILAKEQVRDKKEVLAQAMKRVKAKEQALAQATKRVKAKEQALAQAEKQEEQVLELDVSRASEQVKTKEQALKEAEEQLRAKKHALVRAEEQVKVKKDALDEAEAQLSKKKLDWVRAEEQAKAKKEILTEAEEQVSKKERALAQAKKQASKKEQALVGAEERARAQEQSLVRADEQVKAKEQALKEAEEQLRAKKHALVRAEEQVKVKKDALDEAEAQLKAKERALKEAEWKLFLLGQQKKISRALSAQNHDYIDMDAMDEKPQYVHFLDGGIADNVGLTSLMELLDIIVDSGNSTDSGKIEPPKNIAVIVVNARSDPGDDYGKRDTPPCCLDTLVTTVGAAIDSTSFVLIEQLEQVREEFELMKPESKMFIVDVGLDSINKEVKNDTCRRWFQNIGTNWGLESKQVEALIAVGRALVLDSEKYQDFVNKLGYERPSETVSKVCRDFKLDHQGVQSASLSP